MVEERSESDTRDDSSISWIHGRALPIHDGDGRIRQAAGLSEDVTNLKKIGEESRKSKDGLEERIKERTAGLVTTNEEPQSERRKAEAGIRQRVDDLKSINELAIELAAAPPRANLLELIGRKLKELTGALAAVVATYDPVSKELIVKSLGFRKQSLFKINKILHRKFVGMRFPISPEMLERMRSDVVAMFSDISEMTSGVIPKSAAAAIQKMFGIGEIAGFAFHYGGEIMGVAGVFMAKGKPAPSVDVMRTFSSVAAVALRRKRAEEALRESEERYRTLQVNLPVGVFRTTLAGDLLSANPAMVKMLGYESKEELGPTADVYVDLHQREEFVKRLKKEGAVSNFEVQLRRKDDSVFWAALDARTAFDEKGKIIHYDGILEDITERKHVQETLKREREAFSIIAEAAVNARGISDLGHRVLTGLVVTLDFDSGSIQLYDSGERTLKLKAMAGSWGEVVVEEDITPQSVDDPQYIGAYVARTGEPIFAPDVRLHEIFSSYQERLEQNNVRALISWPLVGADRELLGVMQLVNSQPQKIPTEDRMFFETVAGMFVTVLERKLAEEALRKSEEKHRFLLESIRYPVLALNKDMTVLYCNEAYAEFVGSSMPELQGNNLVELFPHLKGTWFYKAYLEVLESGQPQEIEDQVGDVYLHVSVYPMPWGLLAISSDITECKLAEEEVRRRAENLKAINELAIELAAASPEVDLYELIAEKLKEITGALATVVTINDPQNKALIVKYVALPTRTMLRVNKTLKRKLIGMRLPVSLEILEEMFTKIVERFEDLSEMTFGVVSKPVAFAIQKLLGIGDLTALALQYGGELVGTAAIFMPKGFPSLPLDVARIFAHVAAVALRRKQAEEALRESEEKYRSFVERANDGIAIIQDLELKYVNPRLAEMISYSVEELRGSRATDYVHPDDLPRLLDFFRRRISGEESPSVYETAILAKDGSRIEVEVNVGIINYQGSPASLVFYRDTTERKRAEQELRIKDSAIESSISGVALTDLKGNLTYINGSCLRMWGYDDPYEVLGKPAAEFYESRRRIIKIMKVLRDKGSWVGEMVGVRRDGSTFPVHLSANMVRDERGRPLCTMSSFVDISELKEAEEQIKAALAEKEIMLKEIHHRVKNNLQVISSLLKLQIEHTHDSRALKSLRVSRNRIKSIAIIHEKLYQSKDLARVNFANYIKDLMHFLFRSYGVSLEDIMLRIDISDVCLDIDQAIPCALIVNELVANCLEHAFSNAGGGEIHLEFVSLCEGEFRLTVSDNGIGLPEGFDLEATETLGLQLVGTLVTQLRGEVGFENRNGTIFNITFPKKGSRTQEVG